MRLVLFVFAGAALGLAHDPVTTKLTWSAEISRIVFKRCAGCHREGGRTPMSLLTYEEAKPWATAIRDQVLSRRMPPWGAVKGYGEFRDDPSLTQDEILRIAQWVEGGAPEGDPRYLPLVPSTQPDPLPLAGSFVRSVPAKGATVLGIRVPGRAANLTVRAIRPDGSIVPLLRLHEFGTTVARTYVYREPVVLPSGSRVEPAGAIQLLIRSPERAR